MEIMSEPGTLPTLHRRITDWFGTEARELPWRDPGCSPWGVMVSEFMLQQTPVVRVLPIWTEWMRRWPTPGDLAAESAAEVIRAWGGLGYPRRALRLQTAAQQIVEQHSGQVPGTEQELLALPGVGSYTAAAIACFAYGVTTVVVDTNIRRVHARLVSGRALPEKSLTSAESALARTLLPQDPETACLWNAGVMELGALVCTARSPRCDECPVADVCAWRAAGMPEPHYQPKGQSWAGTDRQLRGAIMAVLRENGSATREELESVVVASGRLGAHRAGPEQWERCLASLVADRLAMRQPSDTDDDGPETVYSLPG